MIKKRDSKKVRKPRQTTIDNKTLYIREHIQREIPLNPEKKHSERRGSYDANVH